MIVSLLVLNQPLFGSATVEEGELLTITCITRNIPDISSFQVLDPNGMPVTTALGGFSVPSVTRAYAGTYICVVRSNRDNSTVSASSVVVILCKLSAWVNISIPVNRIML